MHKKYLLWKITLVVCIFLCATNSAEAQFGDIGRAVKKGYDNTRKTLKKAEKDVRKETGTAIHKTVIEVGKGVENIGKTTKIGGKNIENEMRRAGPHTVTFGKAIGNYMYRTVSSTDQVIQDANRRILEGKLGDALFHAALDPLTNTEKNIFRATQESSWINSAGAIAAAAYGGAGGAAAYASWQTYKATNGDAELAIRAGVLAGFTSMATEGVSSMQTTENFDVVKKAVLSGAVGGLAVAASGGDESDILEGFILAGGMVITQDGYKNAVGHDLDARAATSDPYCAAPGTEGCKVFDKAYYIDENGRPRIDYSKLDPRASFVGQGYMPDPNNELIMGAGRPEYNWAQDRSPYMKTAAKIPGFNAMALFHDNWVLSWGMSEDLRNQATIFPAIVMTYYGTGEALTKKITDHVINTGNKTTSPSKKLTRNDLLMEPNLVLAGALGDGKVSKEFDLDPANNKNINDYHVAKTNLVSKGKYLLIRNIKNGKIQRVLVIDEMDKSSKHIEILLSPLTIKSLSMEGDIGIVQAEPEELILVSTVDPSPDEVVSDIEIAYFEKNDTIQFLDLDFDETTKWDLMVTGPGTSEMIENFGNKWQANVKKGQYMYILTNVSEGQLPWCYYGFFKVIDKNAIDEPTIWDVTGNIISNYEKPFINVNGHHFDAEGEILGNVISMTTDDGSLLIAMTDVPNKSSMINSDKFSKNCSNCFSIMLTDNNTAKIFIATSGNFFTTEMTLMFDIIVKEMNDFVEGTGKSYVVKGAFSIDE